MDYDVKLLTTSRVRSDFRTVGGLRCKVINDEPSSPGLSDSQRQRWQVLIDEPISLGFSDSQRQRVSRKVARVNASTQ